VQAGIHYPFPLHHLKACREVVGVAGTLRECEDWAAECLSLPMFPELTAEQAEFTVSHLVGATRKAAA
jgi:dTDP-4-amino-4,6-dideoxygalactose transaminase